MQLESILVPERTRCDLNAASKKRAIEEVAQIISRNLPYLPSDQIFENLIAREKMGSTAIGYGIAIPHCRMKQCRNITGGLFKLHQPVDFNALDGTDVNILFVLLVPEDETDAHLQTLAMLASRFESDQYRNNLQKSTTDLELYQSALSVPS